MLSTVNKKDRLVAEIRTRIRGDVQIDEPMALHTSYGIGGPADVWVVPQNREDLFELLAFCEKEEVPYRVVGRGTNLLVRDGGISGVVVSLATACDGLRATENSIAAGAGVSLGALSRFAARHDREGLEFCIGIPGCVGGGLATNAGAWGSSLGDALEEATVHNPKTGETRTVEKAEIQFDYRSSNITSFGVVLEAEFSVVNGNAENISRTMRQYVAQRAESQPIGLKSAGSVFKNPPGGHAGVLIDALGFKGYVHGGAMVSDVHANFIVNTGSATAADVLSIIARIKDHAWSATGIKLEEEIEVVGRD